LRRLWSQVGSHNQMDLRSDRPLPAHRFASGRLWSNVWQQVRFHMHPVSAFSYGRKENAPHHAARGVSFLIRRFSAGFLWRQEAGLLLGRVLPRDLQNQEYGAVPPRRRRRRGDLPRLRRGLPAHCLPLLSWVRMGLVTFRHRQSAKARNAWRKSYRRSQADQPDVNQDAHRTFDLYNAACHMRWRGLAKIRIYTRLPRRRRSGNGSTSYLPALFPVQKT